MTTTPLAVAASRSMLSTPVPARPMTFMLGALSSTWRVTLVSERTIRPSCFWNTHQTKSSLQVYTDQTRMQFLWGAGIPAGALSHYNCLETMKGAAKRASDTLGHQKNNGIF